MTEPARSGARPALAVLTRAPVPGRAKTRLAAQLGDGAAARLAAAFLEDVARQVRGPWRSALFVEPPEAAAPLAERTGLGDARPQAGGSVGARMAAAVATLRSEGAGPIAVVGTDIPLLGAAEVEAAFARLARADVVFGPASDGGYYLVALAPHVLRGGWRALFADTIPWSTDRVLRASEGVCRGRGWTSRRLRPLTDIDTAADLANLRRDLATAPPALAPATRRALAEMEQPS